MKKILSIVLTLAMVTVLFAGCVQKKEVSISKVEDLNGLTIGTQKGTTGNTWVLENYDTKKNQGASYKSGMEAAMELKNGKIDCVILDELPAKEIVKQNSELKILSLEFAQEEYAIAVKKGNKDLVDAINKTIKKMKDNGDYNKLLEAFMPADANIKLPGDIQTSGDEIKMGTNAAFKPFEYVEGKDIVGFDISMSQNIAKDMNKKLKVVDMEFDALLTALESGVVDFVAAGMTVNEERLKSVDFSDPYFSSKQVIIVRK